MKTAYLLATFTVGINIWLLAVHAYGAAAIFSGVLLLLWGLSE